MRGQIILRYLGFVLLFNSLFLSISAVISGVNADSAFYPLLFSATVCFLFGIFPFIFVPATRHISNKEGLFIVVFGWLISCLVGMLPYLLWGGVFSFTNAWFESVSGFTTTGASILSDIEAIPLGLLFWRASTHWIGGIGIIVFVLAVIPSLGSASMTLYKSETSPLSQENLQYRTQKTLHIIISIYIGLTALETAVLFFQGMNIFDALTHSFATIATGGFSTKNTSLSYYASPGIEITVMIFMVVSGIHFGMLYLFITGFRKDLLKSTIVHYYLFSMAVGILLVALNIHGNNYPDWSNAFRYAAFQVISLGTSTGFANADSSLWPSMAQLILLFFTLQCACSGSTSGGIKVDRMVFFWKSLARQLTRLRHPKAIIAIKMNHSTVDDEIIENAMTYILIYLVILLISSLLLTASGIDLMTAFSGVAAAMGNVGPGLGEVGSMNNYGGLPDFAKWVLTLDMLLGRLEIYGLFLLISIRQWR